jgi:hypothetical protein
VLPTIAHFKDSVICGFPKLDSTLVAVATYQGGCIGSCGFTWYFLPVQVTKDTVKRATVVANNSPYFVPGEEHRNGYVAVEMVAVRHDGVIRENAWAAFSSQLLRGTPSLHRDDLPDSAVGGRRSSVRR